MSDLLSATRVHIKVYAGVDYIGYRVPLRPDVEAHLVLPRDLTQQDVARLTKFLSVIACDCDEATLDDVLTVFHA